MKKFNNLLYLGVLCFLIPIIVFIILTSNFKNRFTNKTIDTEIIYDTITVKNTTYDTVVIKKYVYDTIRKKTPKKTISNDSLN